MSSNGFTVRSVYYNNKGRKGWYHATKYKDFKGKSHTSIIKKNSMNSVEFTEYIVKIRNVENTQDKKTYVKTFKKQIKRRRINTQNLIDKKRLKAESEPQKETEKNYNLERELSKNKLMFDRDTFKSESQYEREELSIILKIGKRNNLSSMSEEMFRRKLKSYMNPKGKNSNMFIEDIINKWGNEFKN